MREAVRLRYAICACIRVTYAFPEDFDLVGYNWINKISSQTIEPVAAFLSSGNLSIAT
jgi:hypothetical protein